jgi:hypothetical protein
VNVLKANRMLMLVVLHLSSFYGAWRCSLQNELHCIIFVQFTQNENCCRPCMLFVFDLYRNRELPQHVRILFSAMLQVPFLSRIVSKTVQRYASSSTKLHLNNPIYIPNTKSNPFGVGFIKYPVGLYISSILL